MQRTKILFLVSDSLQNGQNVKSGKKAIEDSSGDMEIRPTDEK
jgi:hypothetical protein